MKIFKYVRPIFKYYSIKSIFRPGPGLFVKNENAALVMSLNYFWNKIRNKVLSKNFCIKIWEGNLSKNVMRSVNILITSCEILSSCGGLVAELWTDNSLPSATVDWIPLEAWLPGHYLQYNNFLQITSTLDVRYKYE